ncbi:MAG TPA: ADP-ribosylglycohydrolase family protein [Planctomycetota bacterium]
MFERVVGSILGGAIGDGWGGPFEGCVPGGVPTVPEQLIVSDDTQLTIATCEAVIEAGRVDPERVAARFTAWFRAGRLRGLGASTLKALRDLDAGAHWALSGAKGERSAGNGAAMRIAPLAFVIDPGDEEHRTILRDVCRITHHHDEAHVGALAVVLAIRFAGSSGYDCANLLRDVTSRLPDSLVRDRIARFATFGNDVSPLEVAEAWGRSGFVAESVPLALFAAREIPQRGFVSVVQRAIEAGGDTDTIASMAGQIAGAAVGSSGLPRDLLARLHERAALASTAELFARVVGAG